MDNKGMTLIELIVGFALASAVTVSLFNFITNYSNEEENERKANEITNYKNIITKVLQTDIIKYELLSVEKENPSVSQNGDTVYTFRLTFNKNFDNTSTNVKTLKISTSREDEDKNYIEYPDVNNFGALQTVRYDIPNVKCTGVNCEKEVYDSTTNKCTGSSSDSPDCVNMSLDFTYLSSVETNIHDDNNKIDPVTKTNYGTNYFKLDITITTPENIENSHILIISPLNYKYCKEIN